MNKLDLPSGVSPGSLLARIDKLDLDALRSNAGAVPAWEYLESIRKCLNKARPDLNNLAASANGILHWYFDQGSRADAAHVALSALALDIARMCDLGAAYERAQELSEASKSPKMLKELREILAGLLESFGRDGRVDPERFSGLADRLRKFISAHRSYVEDHFEPGIYSI